MEVTSTKTVLELAFVSPNEEGMDQSDLALPPIEQYLPTGTDPDAAKSLSALYRSHCTSLIECIRYCKEKTFFHLYTSFQGTLTMPVHKLFSHPALASWIEGCDLVLYQNMMRIISKLTLQVLPKPVLDTLRAISERLVPHIKESFQGQPAHVLRAKETPATLFAALLDRSLRVNLTAHAAANMLSNPANRDQMYVEWITMIKPRKVAECIPTRGMDDTVGLLVNEMRDLLDPQNVPWDIECLTIYGDVAVRAPKQTDRENNANNAAHNVLDKWVNLLQSLTEKFPYASPSDIVWCVERVGTSVMRDITLSSGKSFGSWWVTKTWMDEMVCFLAEQGGFMRRTVTKAAPEQVLEETSATKVNARQPTSRYSSGSDELNLPNMSQSQPGRAPFPPVGKAKEATMGMGNGADTHDDSGIGIRTPDDEFTVDKFTFSPPASENLGLGREESQGVA
jgi:regulatory factor X